MRTQTVTDGESVTVSQFMHDVVIKSSPRCIDEGFQQSQTNRGLTSQNLQCMGPFTWRISSRAEFNSVRTRTRTTTSVYMTSPG